MLDLQFICEHQTLSKRIAAIAASASTSAQLVELAQAAQPVDRRRGQVPPRAKRNFGPDPQESDAAAKAGADRAGQGAAAARGRQRSRAQDARGRAAQPADADPQHDASGCAGRGGRACNRVFATWGENRKFDFKPLDHVELMEKLDLLDLEAGAASPDTGFIF